MIGLGVPELAVVIIVLSGLFGAFLLVIKMAKSGGGDRRQMRTDEARVMQEIFDGLARMEQRVETLETLLLDKGRNA